MTRRRNQAGILFYLWENNPDAALSEQQTMSGEERERLRRALQQQLDGEVRIDAHALLARACAQAGSCPPKRAVSNVSAGSEACVQGLTKMEKSG